jgi:hypothetical protein
MAKTGTNIDRYNICHSKECCQSSSNLGEKLGAFPFFGLRNVSDTMVGDPDNWILHDQIHGVERPCQRLTLKFCRQAS